MGHCFNVTVSKDKFDACVVFNSRIMQWTLLFFFLKEMSIHSDEWMSLTLITLTSTYIVLCLIENDGFTTTLQQLHNTPLHEGGAQCVEPTPCEGVLCNYCGVVV